MPDRESIYHEECASWQEVSQATDNLAAGINNAFRGQAQPSGPQLVGIELGETGYGEFGMRDDIGPPVNSACKDDEDELADQRPTSTKSIQLQHLKLRRVGSGLLESNSNTVTPKNHMRRNAAVIQKMSMTS